MKTNSTSEIERLLNKKTRETEKLVDRMNKTLTPSEGTDTSEVVLQRISSKMRPRLRERVRA